MKDYQNSVLKMIDEIIKFVNNNPELLKDPIVKAHFDNLILLYNKLLSNKLIQEADNKGAFRRKKEEKNELAIENFRLTGSVRSFATDTNNDLLYKEINTSKAAMIRLSDENLLSYTQVIINKMTEYKVKLKPYGITNEDIVELTAMHKQFRELLLLPAQLRKGVKVATANIKTIITEILTLLRESIDNDMLQYQDTDPELYKNYQILREIDDSQTTALSIKGKVTGGEAELEVLDYVQVTVKINNTEYVTNTTSKGNYQFKGLPEGKCKVIFKKNYYDTLVINSEVHQGKATKLDVVMTKTIN
jgi:hypothetical protein